MSVRSLSTKNENLGNQERKSYRLSSFSAECASLLAAQDCETFSDIFLLCFFFKLLKNFFPSPNSAQFRGLARTPGKSKMESFATIINDF